MQSSAVKPPSRRGVSSPSTRQESVAPRCRSNVSKIAPLRSKRVDDAWVAAASTGVAASVSDASSSAARRVICSTVRTVGDGLTTTSEPPIAVSCLYTFTRTAIPAELRNTVFERSRRRW